jgi:hypothetical protein
MGGGMAWGDFVLPDRSAGDPPAKPEEGHDAVEGRNALVVRSRQKHPLRAGESAHKNNGWWENPAALPVGFYPHCVPSLKFAISGEPQRRATCALFQWPADPRRPPLNAANFRAGH